MAGRLENDSWNVQVNESTYQRVTRALEKTPLYENEGDEYVNSTGLYVRYEGEIVRVMVFSRRPV